MKKISYIFIFIIFFLNKSYADINNDFEAWKNEFKKLALSNGISEETFNLTIKNTKYLSNVIKYDRYQPEFYEDTKTYIEKWRSTCL
jgi:membrane-bound lytic murein transglycosylase B